MVGRSSDTQVGVLEDHPPTGDEGRVVLFLRAATQETAGDPGLVPLEPMGHYSKAFPHLPLVEGSVMSTGFKPPKCDPDPL